MKSAAKHCKHMLKLMGMTPNVKGPGAQSLWESTDENTHSSQEGECFCEVPPSPNFITRTRPTQVNHTLEDRQHGRDSELGEDTSSQSPHFVTSTAGVKQSEGSANSGKKIEPPVLPLDEGSAIKCVICHGCTSFKGEEADSEDIQSAPEMVDIVRVAS
ncbi:hypothetical protein DTO006G1_9733 [Penicillium roqueforti]|nr:hypothetical protein CBS147337_9680 [Penicillium roqueforti]KAI2674005.1 hypothetical protein CBS147355_7180 [Penicillium roqueforti]KAI2682230.1 hypothetical protein LCP963914a_6645 [Penicillium roqueforti]KAI2694725.1 hypothetical protein CBS147372_9641 [Penicillium roqueforti]KAI2713068.1 hypothetical protein CBS147318_7207 [Penicillium roqueforti]